MTIDLGPLISWLIVGALAGWLIGIALRRGRSTHIDQLINMGIGLAGELLGCIVFWLFKVIGHPISFPLLQNITVNLLDIVAALLGSLVVFAILWFARKRVPWLKRF